MMKIKYDFNPIYRVYELLNEVISGYVQETITDKDVENMDDLIKSILESSDVSFAKETYAIEKEIIPDVYFYFILGAVPANTSIQHSDYINCNGSKYIIVYLNFFDEFITEEIDEESNDIDVMKKVIGNFNYFEGLRDIVLFTMRILYPENVPARYTYSINSASSCVLVAAKVIDNITPIRKADVEGNNVLPFNVIKEAMGKDLNTLLYGIKE